MPAENYEWVDRDGGALAFFLTTVAAVVQGHVGAPSPQRSLDPSHSDSGCSPFEKLNQGWGWGTEGGLLAELNEAFRKKKKTKKKRERKKENMLSSAQLPQSQSQRRRLAR